MQEDLVRVIRAAREQSRELLTQLEQQGQPETERSNSLYLALVSLLKRLTKESPSPATVVAELEQLAALCEGKLSRVKPLLQEAMRMARGGSSGAI